MRDFYFDGIKRLDWGFNNPNITAGLIAILMMAVWILPRIHRWGFWPALVGFGTLGVCLIQTVSRGGVVAAVMAGLVLTLLSKRPWPRNRWVPIAAVLVVLIGYAFWHGVAGRYAQGIAEEDRSLSNRWLIYRMVPAMMVDAPEGWGLKRAHEAFHNYYQPEGRFERYGSLVSSHFTWLAEFGWLGRIGYLLCWLSLLFLAWPSSRRHWYTVVFAVWVAFGASALFTTMANRWVLWAVPGVLFLALLIERVRLRDWPRPQTWWVPVSFTGLLLISAVVFGTLVRPSSPPLQLSKGWVSLQSEHPRDESYWVVEPDSAVVGRAYGQRIRGQLATDDSGAPMVRVGWKDELPTPGTSDAVLFSGAGISGLSGEGVEPYTQVAQWILLNPETPTSALYEKISSSPPIRVVWGEFHPGRARIIWQALANEHDHVTFEVVRAAGKYLPNWTDLIFDEKTLPDSASR